MSGADVVRLERRELKYRVHAARLPTLRADLRALLVPDPHGGHAGGYAVRTLYLDTPGLLALQEKVAGLEPRFKLRIRAYPPIGPGDQVTAEVKARERGAMWKERTRLSLEEVELLTTGRRGALLARRGGDPVVRRFVAAIARLGACSPLVIEYRREAFQDADAERYVRATIDTNIRASVTADLRDPGPAGVPLLDPAVILEVKTDGASPPWLPWLARRHDLAPAALSKYELCCRRTIAALPAGDGTSR